MDRIEDRGADERARCHAQERERTDHAQRPGPYIPFEQVGGSRSGHGHDRAAAERLDQPRRNQLLDRLRQAGQE